MCISEAWGLLLGYDVIQQIRSPLSSSTRLVALSYHTLAWGSALAWTLHSVPLSRADLDWSTPLRRELGPCSASCLASAPEGSLALLPRRATNLIHTLPLQCWRDGQPYGAPPTGRRMAAVFRTWRDAAGVVESF